VLDEAVPSPRFFIAMRRDSLLAFRCAKLDSHSRGEPSIMRRPIPSRFLRLSAFLLAVLPTRILAADPAVSAPDLKPGDTWIFDRSIERGTSGYLDQHFDLKIERVDADSMVVGIKVDGSPVDFQDHVVGLDWSQRRMVDGQQTATTRPLSFPLAIGKTWASDYVDPDRHGLETSAEHHKTYKVVGWEDVTTPAGTFHALRIDGDDKVKAQFAGASGAIGGDVATADGSTVVAHTEKSLPHVVYAEIYSTLYYVPSTKYWVKSVEEIYNNENVRTRRETNVLLSFTPVK
jgi:hypothetical protein